MEEDQTEKPATGSSSLMIKEFIEGPKRGALFIASAAYEAIQQAASAVLSGEPNTDKAAVAKELRQILSEELSEQNLLEVLEIASGKSTTKEQASQDK